MAPNTNSNIAKDALLDVLLKHPDFSAFERKGGAECFPKENVAQICAGFDGTIEWVLRELGRNLPVDAATAPVPNLISSVPGPDDVRSWNWRRCAWRH